MIPQAETLKEAERHFLSGADAGPIMCVSGDRMQECQTYPEAEAFFEAE
jgi:hypothetical protein